MVTWQANFYVIRIQMNMKIWFEGFLVQNDKFASKFLCDQNREEYENLRELYIPESMMSLLIL